MEIRDFADPGHEILTHRILIGATLDDCTTINAEQELDDHVATLIATNPGIGAVLIDRAGHVKLFEPDGELYGHGFTLAPGVYPSIQAAIDAACDGDAIYIAAGKYREQLTIRGKHLDLFGATGTDGSLLVTLESPDMEDLDVDPVDQAGELTARCAVVRIRPDSEVTMRHLIIDGRDQGSRLKRCNSNLDFTSISTATADSIVEHIETRGFDLSDAVRLLDGNRHLRASYATVQSAISAATSGDEIVLAPGIYREDLRIDERITLTCTNTTPPSERRGAEALVVGLVVIAPEAMDVIIDGVAIEGNLLMESADGATASVTLRGSRIG